MLAAVVFALAATVGAAPAGAVQIVTEPGTGATLSSSTSWWTAVQSGNQTSTAIQWPCLTAGTNTTQAGVEACSGTPDAVGSGVIRLVDSYPVRSGEDAMLFSGPIRAADGLKLTFKIDEVTSGYGGSAATVALINGDVPVDTSYPQYYFGGYLNYHSVVGGTFNQGLPNALAGVALDSQGNASGSGLQTGCTGAPGNRANAVALLGPGHTLTGYCYIAGSAASSTTWSANSPRSASMHTVEVDVSPTGDSNPRFIVKVDGTQQINVALSSLSPAGYVGATVNNVSTYRFGFVASNPGDGRDISNIQADSLSSTPPTLSVAVAGHDIGLLAASYQAVTVSNPTTALAEATPVTVTTSLPTGVVVHSTPTGSGWDCSATVTGSSSVSCTYNSLTTATALMQGQSLPALSVPLTLTAAATAGSTTITYNVTDTNSTPASNSGSETIQALLPGTPPVTVTKTAGNATYTASGQPRTFTYTLTNTSSATVTGLTVTDSFAGASTPSCQATTLAAGASTTCTSTYTTTQSDVDTRRVLSGSATAGGMQTGSPFVSAASTVVSVTADPTSSMSVSTTSSPTGFTAVGNSLTLTHTVTNTGATTLADAAPTDVLAVTHVMPADPAERGDHARSRRLASGSHRHPDRASPARASPMPERSSRTGSRCRTPGRPPCAACGSTPPPSSHSSECPNTTLAAGAVMTCTADYIVTQADVDDRSVTTTAVAAGVNALNQPVTSPSGAVTVQGAPVPAVRLQATTTATRLAPAGGKLAFRYAVSNTGDTTVHTVRIGIATKHFGKISCPAQVLAPGQSLTCTGSHTVTQGEWAAKRLAVAIRAVVDDPQSRTVSSPTVRIMFTRNGVTR